MRQHRFILDYNKTELFDKNTKTFEVYETYINALNGHSYEKLTILRDGAKSTEILRNTTLHCKVFHKQYFSLNDAPPKLARNRICTQNKAGINVSTTEIVNNNGCLIVYSSYYASNLFHEIKQFICDPYKQGLSIENHKYTSVYGRLHIIEQFKTNSSHWYFSNNGEVSSNNNTE